MVASITLSNPVFAGFAFYGSIVIIKMFAVAFMTGLTRKAKKVYATPEDMKYFGKGNAGVADEDVDRCRRIHLNDLENIPAFLFLGLFYCAIDPSLTLALWHFRLFVGARIMHTIAYRFSLGTMLRGLSYILGLIVCLSMAVQIFMKTLL